MVWHATTPPPDDPSRDDIIWLWVPDLKNSHRTTQVYIYHLNFPMDSRALKAMVYIVYVLDWAQTCAATYDAFQWFVYGWGDIPTLYGVFTDFLNVPILSSIIGSIVQIYFGWRIWTIAHSWITFAVVGLLSFLQLGACGAVAYYLLRDASEVSRSPGLVRAVGLVRSRGQALSLIRLTIETGTVTAIAAIIDLVFFLKAHNALHQVTGVILCKLYSDTLLVLFNNRLATRMANETSAHVESIFFRAPSSYPSSSEQLSSRPTVHIGRAEMRSKEEMDGEGQMV
ncbi:hypothetical protein C8J57DRAFT_1319460 [Mycena rebaudengoi]|nr:hypothetical protein C8J57DRAFT_1319460 [Mycena rebaudengoi]